MSKSYKYSRRRKPLSIDDCQLRLTDAIAEMEKIILEDGKDHVKIQASHAIGGLINRYLKLMEIKTIEDRLTELEELVKKQLPANRYH